MIVTRDIATFKTLNDGDLRALAVAKTGITDPEILDELCARFYLAALQYNTLGTWDPARGSYETYVTTVLMWCARKFGGERKSTVPLQYARVAHDPRNSPVNHLRERLYDYDQYLKSQIGLTGAYEVGQYVRSKIEGYADRELGLSVARIRRTHKAWVGRFSAAGATGC